MKLTSKSRKTKRMWGEFNRWCETTNWPGWRSQKRMITKLVVKYFHGVRLDTKFWSGFNDYVNRQGWNNWELQRRWISRNI